MSHRHRGTKTKRKINRFYKKIYNLGVSIINALAFVKDIIKDITWPSRKEILLYSVAVTIISVIITAYLVSLDTIFNNIRLITLFR